jgi:hypothetical protein
LRQELVSRLEIPHFVVDMRYGEATIMLYARQENTETGLSEGPPVAELRSAADLTLAWSTELEDVRDGFEPYEPGKGAAHEPGAGTTYRPAVLLDPLAGMMYIVHADVDRITRVDFAKRETPTQDIRPALTLFERWLALGATAAHAKVQDGIERRALLSPDGEVAYTAGVKSKFKQDSVGSWELMQSHLPLQAIRLWDASELYRSDVQADTLEIASDGETMLLQRWAMTAGETESTTFVNAASGEVMGDVAGVQLHAATRMDGTPLLVASSFRGPGRGTSTLTAYDLDTLLLGAWDAPRYADWVLLRK